jgi:hypothetical protein
MQLSVRKQLMVTGYHRLQHLGALGEWVVASSCGNLVVLKCRRVFVQPDSLVVVVVVAWRLPLYAVLALTAVMMIADVVTEDFVQLQPLVRAEREKRC